MIRPLPREAELRQEADPVLWRELTERPLGEAMERRFRDETVRGVVATDALIGTFARMDDPSLVQNRCFLYHLIGNGTGEWRVPVGGMGAVTGALASAFTASSAPALRAEAASAPVTAPIPPTGTRHSPVPLPIRW